MLLVGSWNENQWICPFGRAVGTNTFWYFVQSAWVFTYTVSIFSCNTVLAWSTSDKFGAELVRLVICLSQEVWLDVSQLVQTWTSNRGSGEPWKFSTNYLRGSWCALFFFFKFVNLSWSCGWLLDNVCSRYLQGAFLVYPRLCIWRFGWSRDEWYEIGLYSLYINIDIIC